jgi:nucleoside 2-deoxyribosyltransferase
MKVYLCGPINGRADDDCKGWREYVKERIHDCLDPMDRDYRGRELEPGIAKEIVENDKADILGCDAMIVYYDKPSVGTSMEILFARQANGEEFRTILVDKSDKPLSPWLIYHCKEITKSLDEAIALLRGPTSP